MQHSKMKDNTEIGNYIVTKQNHTRKIRETFWILMMSLFSSKMS